MPDSSQPRGKRSRKQTLPLPTSDELRELVDRSCRRHQDSATKAIDAHGKGLAPVVREMLEDDLVLYDETRGEFAVWLLAELMIHDLMRHPDELLLVNWYSFPPHPTSSEKGPEIDWYVESQPLADALNKEQISDLFLLALQSSCDNVRRRAERAWRAIKHISGSNYNLRGATLRRHFNKYRDLMVEELSLAVKAEDLETRDAAERALAVCQGDADDWNR